MKIILCGAVGSGKTTIAHFIEKEYGFKYILDLDILKEKGISLDDDKCDFETITKYSNIILDYLTNSDGNIVLDSAFSVAPSAIKNYNNLTYICMGFSSVAEDTLFSQFRSSSANDKYTDSKLKHNIGIYKNLSALFLKECEKCGVKFFDISKQKELVAKDILEYLNLDKLK
ncbi:MAG: hypothetical protein J6V40_02770 [Clostridia bacterium]|nr:hypothetical protein [Clostridia bacterium]